MNNYRNNILRTIGKYGSEIESGTTTHTGNYFALQCVTDVTLTTLTGNIEGTVTGITYPAGLIIYGEFTTITLASGTAILYLSE